MNNTIYFYQKLNTFEQYYYSTSDEKSVFIFKFTTYFIFLYCQKKILPILKIANIF